ncbi:DHA2 family efflux MFS transporter permease subunit [Myceligenerans indicum]|uniref:Multidrug efflux MFS transporter n=1 Tax=Myceligenerans indicum TaxID=2593663 RepID=A0ABS1LHP5_9MICO|nr:DHA2 family efflux MFS transporter permease subunit [Myceligenerans indicum]MBL0885668.1 multidrug efflux MFS transporter [Myceligenerans indicum]
MRTTTETAAEGTRAATTVRTAGRPRAAETRVGLVVALGGLLAVLDTTIVTVTIPELTKVFEVPLATTQWLSSGYTLAMVATMPLAAWLAGRWGASRVYVAALLGFAVASVGAGLAGGLPALLAARVVLGLAGGLITPLGMTIAFAAAPPERRGRMASLVGLPLFLGPVLGPVLGGFLLEHFSWHAVFLVTAPPALLAAAGVLRWARTTAADRKPRPDVAGAALLVPGAVCTAYGISAAGTPWPVRVLAVLAGLTLGAAFARRSLGRAEPLLRIRLLRRPEFGRNALGLGLYTAPYFGSMLLMPTYVQVVRGDSALTTALVMVPGALALGASVQVAGRLLDRFGAKPVIGTGLTISVVQGAIAIAVLRPDTPYVVLGALAALQGLGSGAVIMPTMATATRRLRGADLASGSAILPLVSTLANALGTATLTAVFTALTALLAPGASLAEFGVIPVADRMAATAAVVDAQRLTTAVSLAVILSALVLRLRDRGRSPGAATDDLPVTAGKEAR